jgi:hypothetical protein
VEIAQLIPTILFIHLFESSPYIKPNKLTSKHYPNGLFRSENEMQQEGMVSLAVELENGQWTIGITCD